MENRPLCMLVTMYSSCLLLLFASSSLVSADVAATITRDGVTSIYGNSFGVPGVDATYDYVVSGESYDSYWRGMLNFLRLLEEVQLATLLLHVWRKTPRITRWLL